MKRWIIAVTAVIGCVYVAGIDAQPAKPKQTAITTYGMEPQNLPTAHTIPTIASTTTIRVDRPARTPMTTLSRIHAATTRTMRATKRVRMLGRASSCTPQS